MITSKAISVGIIAAFLLGYVFLITSHCSTTDKQCMLPEGCNSLGVVQYTENPVQYLEASIVGGTVHNEGKQELTTIRFQPTGTYSLFTEGWTFCGNVADMFDGKTGVVVLSFSKVQHHRDCYDLYSVHEVKEEPMK